MKILSLLKAGSIGLSFITQTVAISAEVEGASFDALRKCLGIETFRTIKKYDSTLAEALKYLVIYVPKDLKVTPEVQEGSFAIYDHATESTGSIFLAFNGFVKIDTNPNRLRIPHTSCRYTDFTKDRWLGFTTPTALKLKHKYGYDLISPVELKTAEPVKSQPVSPSSDIIC